MYLIATLAILLSTVPALAAVGPQATEVVLLKFADHPEEPCTAAFARDVVYGQYADWLRAESRGQEWITGSEVWGWQALPHDQAYYCPPAIMSLETIAPVADPEVTVANPDGTFTPCNRSLFNDGIAAAATHFDVYSKQLIVFVYNAVIGANTGAPSVFTGCSPDRVGLSLATMQHEGGHAQAERLLHASGWTCPAGDVGPSLADLTAGGCRVDEYGDRFDPMGGAGIQPDQHYSTRLRDRLGWQKPLNIRAVYSTGTATVTRADVQTDAVQEVRVYPPHETAHFYSLEYRAGAGVMARLARDPSGSEETFLVNRGRPITTGEPLEDPYRNLTISVPVTPTGDVAVIDVAFASTFTLSWNPPTSNCDGSMTDDLDHYDLWTERIIKTGETVWPDGSITDTATRTGLTVPLPLTTLSADLAYPEPGGMIAWRVSAVDFAGNQSCDVEVGTP